MESQIRNLGWERPSEPPFRSWKSSLLKSKQDFQALRKDMIAWGLCWSFPAWGTYTPSSTHSLSTSCIDFDFSSLRAGERAVCWRSSASICVWIISPSARSRNGVEIFIISAPFLHFARGIQHPLEGDFFSQPPKRGVFLSAGSSRLQPSLMASPDFSGLKGQKFGNSNHDCGELSNRSYVPIGCKATKSQSSDYKDDNAMFSNDWKCFMGHKIPF